jgi:hypothetical protein
VFQNGDVFVEPGAFCQKLDVHGSQLINLRPYLSQHTQTL